MKTLVERLRERAETIIPSPTRFSYGVQRDPLSAEAADEIERLAKVALDFADEIAKQEKEIERLKKELGILNAPTCVFSPCEKHKGLSYFLPGFAGQTVALKAVCPICEGKAYPMLGGK
jgi:hypothetical protein